MFELCEDLFDRVEIGAIGRQEDQMGAGGSDRGAHRLTLVASEVVHHNDIAFGQCRDQYLLDIDQEAFGVDRAIKHPRRCDPIVAQRSQERHGLPVAERDFGPQPLAFGRPSTQRRHVGLGPRLVDEHQSGGINLVLVGLPSRPLAGDVGPILLAGQHGFF